MFKLWDKIALIRSHQIESGEDITFNDVFIPYYVKFIRDQAPVSIIEIGAGTGHLCFSLINYCRHITALEPSRGMYEIAKQTLQKTDVKLIECSIEDYRIDNKFDLLISHLCLQTLESPEQFLNAIKIHMHPESTSIITIPHPCFYNKDKKFFSAGEYIYMNNLYKIVELTITNDTNNKFNIPYHHHPLSFYFNLFSKMGFHLMKFDEIMPDISIQSKYSKFRDYPRYCTFHLILNKN